MNGLILCTKQCNLRCNYCFEENMHAGCMLTRKEIQNEFSLFLSRYLDKFTRELISVNNQLNRRETDITFHGGEPLLVGYDLLKQGFETVHKYPNTTIGIQTNGTLITDEIIELFLEHKVRVGVSIDGPKAMHDAYRKTEFGAGSFDRVYENILKMKKAGVMVGALATVTDRTVVDAEAFYRFFRDISLDFSFNPCFTDPNQPSSCKVLNMQDFIEFYKKMFDLWISDEKGGLSISCFERILSSMMVKTKPWMEVCSFIPDCSRTTVAVNTEGEFYRCLHYCMDHKNKIGDLDNNSLSIALGDENFGRRWDYLKQGLCKDCDVQEYCCGGCPYVAESIKGTINSQPNTCASQKAIVHYIYDYMQRFKRATP